MINIVEGTGGREGARRSEEASQTRVAEGGDQRENWPALRREEAG